MGRAFLYDVNQDHVLTSAVLQIVCARGLLFERLHDEIAGWRLGPLAAVVFGSVARGDSMPRSDIDLLIRNDNLHWPHCRSGARSSCRSAIVRPATVDADEEEWRGQIETLSRLAFAWTGNDARVLELGADELQRPDEVVAKRIEGRHRSGR